MPIVSDELESRWFEQDSDDESSGPPLAPRRRWRLPVSILVLSLLGAALCLRPSRAAPAPLSEPVAIAPQSLEAVPLLLPLNPPPKPLAVVSKSPSSPSQPSRKPTRKAAAPGALDIIDPYAENP